MAVPVSHSEGTYVVLRENRGATLWRRLENDAIGQPDQPDTWDITPFFTLNPRGPTPEDVPCTLVAAPVGETPAYFEFSLTVPMSGNRIEYQCGWIDAAGNREVAFYGEIVSP